MNTRTARLTDDELEALGDRIAATAALIDGATHRLLTGLREFDEAEGWHRQGAVSAAHWLSWRAGISLGPAREQVRVARALGGLPLVDEALRRGEVSYSKVRAITRVATAATEAQFLEWAKSGSASQLETVCRLYRAVEPAQPTETESGAASAGTSDLADGLVAMCDAVLRGDALDRAPTEVLLHVDAATLEEGQGIPAETSRRVLCDTGLVAVIEKDGKTVDIGRKRRTISAAIKRALRARDGGCRFPGCGRLRWVDGHHIEHWVDGGETKLSNLVLLCGRHHTLVHEDGYTVELHDGEVTFRDRRGRALPATGPTVSLAAAALDAFASELYEEGIEIDSETAPTWDGSPVDYHRAVDRLLSLET